MANGYFERGEMYDILFSEGFEGEIAAHRPGIIVSSDAGNRTCPSVLMVYTTTTTTANKRISVNHEFVMNGWRNYALCNQIASINKTRLKKFYGKLSDFDMGAIDNCLEEALDLGHVDETALREKDNEIKDRDVLIGDLQTEVAGVKAEIGKKDEEIASLKMEIEMWQKCYGRCMDMLVDVKVSGDVARRMEPKVGTAASLIPELRPEPPKQPEPPKEPEELPVQIEEKLDINTCTATALKKIGFSLAVARKIVEGRPFKSVEDLKRVNGVKASLFRIVEPRLCCNEVKKPDEVKKPVVNGGVPDLGYEAEDTAEVAVPEKVNINTATMKELKEKLGISEYLAYTITGWRNKNGLFVALEELKEVKNLPNYFYDRYKDSLTVGEVVVVDAPSTPEKGKVNVNTANAQEIHEVTGLTLATGYCITGYRKKHGPYTKLDDLLNVTNIFPGTLKRLEGVLEV